MNELEALRQQSITGVRPLIPGRNIWQGYFGPKHEAVVLKGVFGSTSDSKLRLEEQLARDIAAHPRNRTEGEICSRVIPSYGIIETAVGPYFVTPRMLPVSVLLDEGAKSADVISFLMHGSDAVAAVHCADKYYNDVKPENFVLRSLSDAKAVVIDFGTVTPRTPGANIGIHGTPGYASPQQLSGLCDARGDVFGLGASAYKVITGAYAMRPVSAAHLQRIVGEYNADPSKLTAVPSQFTDLPLKAKSLITAMLEPKSENRPSLGEVRARAADALQEISDRTV